MELNNKQSRVIALAGLFQASQIVTDLAKTGMCDIITFNALTDSLFVLDPETPLDAYNGDINSVRTGLELLQNLSRSKLTTEHAETARYAISLLALQKQLSKKPELMKTISSRLKHLQYKKDHFTDDNADISNSLSGLYQDTISTLKFRIQVTGNMEKLTQPAVSDKVRTMLFAGIRSALLWRQLGGSKFQLIFGRGEIENISKDLLNKLPEITRH